MKLYIKEWRKRKGMSQKELIELSGVSKATIYYLENDLYDHAPQMSTLRKVADALRIKTTTLFSMPK